MSNRLTFSLASLIVLLAFGLVFVAAPATAATFDAGAKVADQTWKQGQSNISITLPTATAEEDPAGVLTATLSVAGGADITPITPTEAAGETPTEIGTDGGPLEGLLFVFDADTGEGKLMGDNAHHAVTALALVTYTVAEVGGTAAVLPAFAVEIIAADDLMFPAGTDIENISLIVGTPYSEVLPAAVGGVEPLTYSIAGTLPDEMDFIEETRLLTGIPRTVFSREVLTYTVTDNAPTPVTDTLRFTIAVAARPTGPSFAIAKVPDAKYTKGHVITAYTLPAADETYAVGDVTYTLRGLPTGLSFDATSRMLTGTPDPTRIGATTATYTATDTAGNVASVPFKITVADVVSVTAPDDVEDHVLGEPFTDITVADAMNGTGDSTVTVTGLPAGLTFADMKITGDPTAIATTTVSIDAVDSLGAEATTANFTIEVKAAPTLVFTSVVAPQSYEVGTPIAPMLLPAGQGGIPPYTYALDGLPDGLSFDPKTRLFSGTPMAAQAAADYNYVISDSAFDHIDAASRTTDHPANTITLPISITVTASAPAVNAPPDFGDATVDNIVATSGVAIDGRFLPEADDADGDTLTYSLSPALPAGLTFTPATRSLTGTPTVARMAETPYIYKVDDGNGGTDTIGFFITVNADPPPADPTNMPPAFADDAAIDSITATVGVAISGRFLPEATDSDGDRVAYALSPALPRGLTFNRTTRALTGTPTATMVQTAYTYTAVALGGTDTLNFFITVNAAPPPPVTPTALGLAPIANQTFVQGTAIGTTGAMYVQLPSATGGQSPYTYSWHKGVGQSDITTSGDNGLSVDTSNLRLSGTPTAVTTGTDYTWRATDAAGDSVDSNFTVIVNAPTVTPPIVKAKATFSGTLSLTVRSVVTVTFDKAVPALTAADFAVTNGSIPANGIRAKTVTAPTVANTVWEVAVDPNPLVDSVSITIAATSAVAQPAATNGSLITKTPEGMLSSITAATGADDTKPFVVTLTFAAALPTGVNVAAADLMVTPVTAKAGTPTLDVADSKMWHVLITPTAGMDTKIELSAAGKLKFSYAGAALTVKKKATPPIVEPVEPGDVTATYDDDATPMTTTLKGVIAADGFGVIRSAALPDIQRFYSEGGSISVLSSKTGAAAKDVVISEIMWGLNLRAIGAARSAHQFIELYNTTSAAIDLADVKLTFDGANTPPAAPTGMTLLDQVSNVSGEGWLISDAPGQSGRIAVPDDVTTFVPADLISMYRNINYTNVVSTTLNTDDAAKNRVEQLKAVPGGNALDSWEASDAADTYGVNLIGSPGKQHFAGNDVHVLKQTDVKRNMFIINEIGNHSNDKYDWVEIKRVGSADNLKKWRLSQVTDDKKDTKLVSFPDNDDHKIPAEGGVLLIVNSDPYQDPNHPLAAGIGINGAAKNRAETTGVKSRYYVDSGLKIQNGNKRTLLILRNSIDDGHLGKPNNIQDVLGTLGIADNAPTLRTGMWPLVATPKPHDDVLKDLDEDLRAGYVYTRNVGGGTGKHHIGRAGYTGVGYKRSAANSAQHGGTPGYDNGAVKVNEVDLANSAMISISEIMYAKNRNEPQWIELHNSSMTQAINLSEWKLKLEHDRDVADSDIRTSVTTNNLGGGIIIQPNQTVLIVSNTTGRTSRASQGAVDFPATRVINLWGQRDKLEVASGVTRLTYKLLSQTAFKLTLMDKSDTPVDVVGNLGAAPAWELPASENGEGRSSIIRRYTDGVPDDGTMAASWTFARDSQLTWVRFNETYYGSPDDIGTPGFKAGGPLPVSLSKFRPERLDDGSIRIAWVTESELNNAGFNILRSETKDGEFKQINTKLIAGKGTTSERSTYTYTDPSAKPNVVYYYQIQDVSMDGKVTTLRETRLKGHISAAGKLTTTWGELKALQ